MSFIGYITNNVATLYDKLLLSHEVQELSNLLLMFFC